MFTGPSRKGFTRTQRVPFNKYKEKMSAPNNAKYVLIETHSALPNSKVLGITAPLKLTDADLSLDLDASYTWEGNHTFNGEVEGTRESILLSHDAGASLGQGQTLYMKAGEVLMTNTKALTMIRAGSIVGISINYDITNDPNSTFRIEVLKNGSVVWNNIINSDVGDDKETKFTQSRGDDNFDSGDTIAVRLNHTGLAIGNIDVNDVVVMLEFYYNPDVV